MKTVTEWGGRPTALKEAAGLTAQNFWRNQMRLHDNQLKLIYHLARFNLLDYISCLHLLDTEGSGNQVALSYAFRPLTRNKYLTKHKDGSVAILAKGRSLFPDIKPLISTGGGVQSIQRVMEVSRMAALMEKNGILVSANVPKSSEPVFIPSSCWRNIAPGILSTTRFTGILMAGKERLAVYDIGDGSMEWQVRAEGSLFYTKYGSYETKATGMILICQDEKRNKIARNIIRQTMWSRRRLLSNNCLERNKPARLLCLHQQLCPPPHTTAAKLLPRVKTVQIPTYAYPSVK